MAKRLASSADTSRVLGSIPGLDKVDSAIRPLKLSVRDIWLSSISILSYGGFVAFYSKDILLKNEDFSILFFAFHSLNLAPLTYNCAFFLKK